MTSLSESMAKLPANQQRALLAQLLRQQAAAGTYSMACGQKDLWAWYQICTETDRIEFNVLFAWAIRSPLNSNALQQAFQILVDRHGIFRTTFGEQDGEPFQRVARRGNLQFTTTDATDWSAERLREVMDTLAHQRFNLEKGPLMRVDLFVRQGADPVLLLAIHHIAMDMWSLSILLDELGRSYTALCRGHDPQLPPLQRQYSDFVRWQTQLLATPEGQRLGDYWRDQLVTARPIAQLPTDRSRPLTGVFKGACHAFALPQALSVALKELACQSHTTLYAVLMAAFQVLLYRYSHQEDLTVLTLTVGRQGSDWAGVLGYFINPVALRADHGGNPPFTTLLTQIHHRLMAALEHQLYPFSLALAELPEPAFGQNRLTDIIFVFQKSHRFEMERSASGQEAASAIGIPAAGQSGAQLGLGDLVLDSFPLAWRADQRFVLQLMMVEAGGSLSGVFQYAAELFEPDTIARMATHLEVLLQGIVAQPQTPIGQLPLISPTQKPHANRPLPTDLRSRLQQVLRKKENS